MEAASARYATRDRFAAFAEPAQSPLQRYIRMFVPAPFYHWMRELKSFLRKCCGSSKFRTKLSSWPGNIRPDKFQKGHCVSFNRTLHCGLWLSIFRPREAAVAIVNYINHRNQNVSLLALAVSLLWFQSSRKTLNMSWQLLDICVKNCGYPFHLQISTKEFLNELVRRFPERPPLRPSRVQKKILELIEEWRQTICQTSRYKEDLGFIRDMHRLLSYKGYMFPEVRREDAAVLNPSDVLDPIHLLWYILTVVRIFNPQMRWKKKKGQHKQRNCRSSFAGVDQKTFRKLIDWWRSWQDMIRNTRLIIGRRRQRRSEKSNKRLNYWKNDCKILNLVIRLRKEMFLRYLTSIWDILRWHLD